MNNYFDVIIIGGGAAGLMAAISCKRHHSDLSVAIFDRTFALGRKILVAGAGRCNITNIHLNKSLEKHYYGARPEFIQSIFDQFDYEDIVHFFADLGIELYIERKTNIGKVFPVTDQAKTVTSLLEDELERLGVEVFLNKDCVKIEELKTSDEKHFSSNFKLHFQALENKIPIGKPQEFSAGHVILSAGGKTYPALGSNGSGYTLAQFLKHTIIPPVPSALPLVGKNPLSQELQGTKMEIEVTSYIEGENIKTRTDDVMFTQYGLSGPAILNVSREISIYLNREKGKEAFVVLNFFPGKNKDEVRELLQKRWDRRPNQRVERSFYGLFQNKTAASLLKLANIPLELQAHELKANEVNILIHTLTAYKIRISETRGWNEAEFTAGGVDDSEIKQSTLESKKVPYLYFCGEIVNVDGDVGGFNLSWAWSSGFVAGKLLT